MRKLVVLATGLNGSPKIWHPLIKRLREEDSLIGSDWLIFHHCGCWNLSAFSKYFTKSIEGLSLDLKSKIEQKYLAAEASGEPYDEIICIGHSTGGLLIRQAYLVATGAYIGEIKSGIPWAEKVSRFVLIAATNRGVKAKNFIESSVISLLKLIGCVPILQEIMLGDAFITNLRIAWIRYISSLNGQEPIMIQLLGLGDRVVDRKDSIDIQQFPNGIQYDITGVNHSNIYRLQGEDAESRYTFMRWAILQSDPKKPEQIPSTLQGRVTVDPGESATEITVFIVHGIRDGNSGWASDLEKEIYDRDQTKFKVVRSTYGFFSAFNFLFPWLRKKNIQWFQDRYSYQLALNPQSEFYFIGHSNGTYMLGESLKQLSAMKFTRIYLAGSVLPCEYPWQERFDLDQVKVLRNDRSSWDWPVGILCSGLRGLGMKDIGSAGFDGFNFDDHRTEEVFFYNGGHGKPLMKENHGSILSFILDEDRSHPPNLMNLAQISSRFQLISRVAPFFAPFLLLLVLCIIFLWVWWIFQGATWASLAFWLKLMISISILYFTYILAKTV